MTARYWGIRNRQDRHPEVFRVAGCMFKREVRTPKSDEKGWAGKLQQYVGYVRLLVCWPVACGHHKRYQLTWHLSHIQYIMMGDVGFRLS
jgi:hypothetical protein